MGRFDEPGAVIRPFRHRQDLFWRIDGKPDGDARERPLSVEILGRGPILPRGGGAWRTALVPTVALRPLMSLHIPLHVAYGPDLPLVDRAGFAARLDAWLHGPALLTRHLGARGEPAAALADLAALARLAGARHGVSMALRLHLEPHGGHRDIHALLADGRILALPNDAPLRRAAHCVARHHGLHGHDTQVAAGQLQRVPLALDVAPARIGLRAAAARLRPLLPDGASESWLREGFLALLRGPCATDGWLEPWRGNALAEAVAIPGTDAAIARRSGERRAALLLDGTTLAPDPEGGPLLWARRPWIAACVDLDAIGARAAEAARGARRRAPAWGGPVRPAWHDPDPEAVAALVRSRIIGQPLPAGAPEPEAFLRAVLDRLQSRHGETWELRIHAGPNPLFRDSASVDAPNADIWTSLALEALALALVARQPPACGFSWFCDGTGQPVHTTVRLRSDETSAHERLAGRGVVRRATAAYGRAVRRAHEALEAASRAAESAAA